MALNTKLTEQENTDTATFAKQPGDSDSTKQPDASATAHRPSHEKPAPTKAPVTIIPVDWDTPATEQIAKNAWNFAQNYKYPKLPDFHPIRYSNSIEAGKQIGWNTWDTKPDPSKPLPVIYSNTIPVPKQIENMMDAEEHRLRYQACLLDQLAGKHIDVRIQALLHFLRCIFRRLSVQI